MMKKMNRKGFTLIELMIVVAIIGILAAIAIPQFASYRERAQDAAAKSALKNLATAQENYYLDNNTYASTTGDLASWFTPEAEISIGTISVGTTPDTWSATAQHTSSSNAWLYDSAAGGLSATPQ